MAWTAPRTWTTGELVTAAILNTHVRDNLNATGTALVTTKGDLTPATGATALQRLAVGNNGQVLTAESACTAGIRWRGGLTLISNVELTSEASSMDFISLSPASYLSFEIQYSVRSSQSGATGDKIVMQYNGITATSSYDYMESITYHSNTTQTAEGLGSTVLSIADIPAENAPANIFGAGRVLIADPGASATRITSSGEGAQQVGTATNNIRKTFHLGTTRSASTVTSIKLRPNSGSTFKIGSRASLWGYAL